jgi:hypothetical protein
MGPDWAMAQPALGTMAKLNWTVRVALIGLAFRLPSKYACTGSYE